MHAVLKSAIGIGICLLSSLFDAAGINLQRRDHVKNSALPMSERLPVYQRPIWVLGFMMYILSQTIGAPIALNFIRPGVLAPISSAALVFNLFFAAKLVGSPITRGETTGMVIILISSLLIAIFGELPKDDKTLEELLEMYNRPVFIIYFVLLISLSLVIFVGSLLLHHVIDQREMHNRQLLRTLSIERMKKTGGIMYSVAGAIMASMTVVLTDATVGLVKKTWNGDNMFVHPMPIIIATLLITTAIVQVYCTATALKLANSTTTLPVGFALYSSLALIDQNVYYDLWGKYQWYNHAIVFPCILSNALGVYMITSDRFALLAQPSQDEEENAFLNNSNGADGQEKSALYVEDSSFNSSVTAIAAVPESEVQVAMMEDEACFSDDEHIPPFSPSNEKQPLIS